MDPEKQCPVKTETWWNKAPGRLRVLVGAQWGKVSHPDEMEN